MSGGRGAGVWQRGIRGDGSHPRTQGEEYLFYDVFRGHQGFKTEEV